MPELSTRPPPAAVPANDWRSLHVPEIGAWKPSASVSVVIPAYQAQSELRLLFSVLCEQTYPASLTQVVVVDDGSTPHLDLSGITNGLEVELLYRERGGAVFGSGGARNMGAEHAEGEILVFSDADMLPSPEMIEAHARWHHLASDLVTLGFRQHIEVDGLNPDELREAARNGGLKTLIEGHGPEEVGWIEEFFRRTDDLTARRLDLFRVLTGGNFAVRAETWKAVGGIHEFGIRGVEDTELGYRLANYGAVLIPEPMALSWHQGKSFFKRSDADRAKETRAPVMANYIPVGRFRPMDSRRIFAVPSFQVETHVRDEPVTEVVRRVDALLDGYTDLSVNVRVDHAHPDREFLENAYTADARVSVGGNAAGPPSMTRSPFVALWPAEAVPGPETFAAIHERMLEEPHGALHITVPGESPRDSMIHVFTTSALARSTRLASRNGGERGEILGELFGERWISGLDLGVQTLIASAGEKASGRKAQAATPRPGTPTKAERELAEQLRAAEQKIDALLRRRSLQLATNAGRTLRKISSFGPTGLLRSVRSKDLRGALVRLGLIAAAALVVAATVALILIAASQSQALAAVVGAIVVAVITASMTVILTSSDAELRRLSKEREGMRLRLRALERSLTEEKSAVNRLEREKQSLDQELAAQEDSLRGLEQQVADLSQRGPMGWLARWRRR